MPGCSGCRHRGIAERLPPRQAVRLRTFAKGGKVPHADIMERRLCCTKAYIKGRQMTSTKRQRGIVIVTLSFMMSACGMPGGAKNTSTAGDMDSTQMAGAAGRTQNLLSVPALGDPLVLPQNSNYTMAASGQLWPYQTISVNGINFDVAANGEHQVAYVATGDANFRTPEGLSVESTLEQVLATGAQAPLAETGWAYHTALPSGWCVAFVSGAGITEAPLQASSKVSWFFKRHGCQPNPTTNSYPAYVPSR
jgi:hypothetical protein